MKMSFFIFFTVLSLAHPSTIDIADKSYDDLYYNDARDLYYELCKAGNSKGCLGVAKVDYILSELTTTVYFGRKACNMNEPFGCEIAISALFDKVHRENPGLTDDEMFPYLNDHWDLFWELTVKECEFGNKLSCEIKEEYEKGLDAWIKSGG